MPAIDPTLRSLRDTLGRLHDKLIEKGEGELSWTSPISAREIDDAELRLGVALPPSYVGFVRAFGCWRVRRRDGGTSRSLLTPAEMVEVTLATRTAAREAGDDDTAEVLDDALLFQENLYRDNFYVFQISSADERLGEMRVDAWFHDDTLIWGDSPWYFVDHVVEFVDNYIAELDGP